LKSYYELLGVEPAAAADEIKRAFRREIARYHPDKVQHLGAEFQEIAAVRAAELTEAYRILMDPDARARYDQTSTTAVPSRAPAQRATTPASKSPAPEPDAPAQQPDTRFDQYRATTSNFVNRAAGGLLLNSVAAAGGTAVARPVAGFDAAFDIKSKGGLFKKAEPAVRLLVRFVAEVDAAAIVETWPLALKATPGKEVVLCLLLVGARMAPSSELAAAVAQLRRKTRNAGPVLVPVDMRDWDALFPPESPPSVRAILQRLREGKL